MIKEGKNKEERFEMLSQIAKYQLNILNNAEKIKLLGNDKNDEGSDYYGYVSKKKNEKRKK